jgi:hypothetical protein
VRRSVECVRIEGERLADSDPRAVDGEKRRTVEQEHAMTRPMEASRTAETATASGGRAEDGRAYTPSELVELVEIYHIEQII